VHRAGAQKRRWHPWRQARQRLRRIGFTGTGGATQLLQGFVCVVTLLQEVRLDRTSGQRLPGLSGDQELARALRQRLHGVGRSLGQGGVSVAQRRWDAGEPCALGLGALLEVLGAREGTIGHEGGGAVGGGQGRHGLLADLTALRPIAAGATARRQQPRHPRWGLAKQLEHDGVQSRALSPTLASGAVYALFVRRLGTVGAAVDMQAGRSEMHPDGSPARP